MIAKLIMLALIAGVIYFLILPKFRAKKPDKKIENFVECESCLTYVSLKETLIKDGKYICQECNKGQKCR